MNTEKEWFEDMISWPEHGATHNEVKDILRAQKKRDWEEFREMVQKQQESLSVSAPNDSYSVGGSGELRILKSKIDAKLAELNKPKE